MKTAARPNNKRFLVLATTMALSTQINAANLLEEVVVTAQKRAQNLNDIGIAVSAFSSNQIKDLGITDATDLAKFTPGLQLTETGVTGVPVYTIRGVGFDDYNANSSSTVGIYVDEVNLPYPTMTRGETFDMERIEILKGPQGTLYGRNSTGGAINFITNKPSEEFEAGITLEYARYETFRSEGFINGSLGDSVNGRLAFAHTQSGEGWQKSASSNETLGELDKNALRGILDWTISDAIDLQFNAHWYEDQSENPAPQYFAYVPLVPGLAGFFPAPPLEQQPDLDDPRSADWSRNFTPQRDNRGAGASVRLNWDMGSVSLISITAYEEFKRDESNDWDGTAVENLDVFMDTEIEAWSQEIRLVSNTNSALSWMVGAYASGDEVDESWVAKGSQSTIYYGLYGAVDTRYTQDASTAALFGNLEWNFSDQLRLNLGARYTKEDREFEGCTYDVDGGLSGLYNLNFGPTEGVADRTILSSSALSQGSCVAVDPSRAQLTIDPSTGQSTYFSGVSGVFKDDFSTDNLSGKIGLDWFPNEDWLVYSSISNGYKSGGYNGAAASTWDQLSPYDEETLLAYEFGFKATLLDGSMQLNSSAFLYDYTDKQIVGFTNDPVFGLLTQLVNVPESEILGVEAGLDWTPLDGLFFKLGAIWLDSEVKEYEGLDGVGNQRDFAGMELAQTSQWQYNAMASYEWPLTETLNLRVAVDVNYKDEYQSAIDDNDLFHIEDYTIWNSRLGLVSADGRWQATLWGRNLTDEYYYTSANLSNDYWFRTAGKGATYGATFTYNFY
ncbi:MAG: iron complex outermembrane receptor protein [Halioglobus sp.]|jgi:iron complex outermembrane receptor protein